MNMTLPQSIRAMLHALFSLPSQSPHGEPTIPRPLGASVSIRRTVVRPAVPAASFLQMEVDGSKKATGRFTLFSNGRVLTGTLEGTSEALTHIVEVSLQTHAGARRKACGTGHASLPIARSRYEACDH